MERYLVKPGEPFSLVDHDPADRSIWTGDKKEAKAEIARLNGEFELLQELLYAEAKRKVLVVLQATDTGGKDGTIRHVFDGVNPQGVKVAKFGVPTEEEREHDFLWRIHKHAPRSGEITIFNRSHYEDVLVVRVHNYAPKAVWSKRYEHINAFEKLLADEGTTVVKFYLNISKQEQAERLRERLDVPEKNWKFQKGDLEERKLWDEYQEAFRVALEKTSKPWAPWYVIPSDRKWVRNLVITKILIELLSSFDMKFPAAEEGLKGLVIE